jgi:hypothetical protein
VFLFERTVFEMSAFLKFATMGAAVVVGLAAVAPGAPVEVARFQNGLTAPFGVGTYSGTEDTYLNGGATSAFDKNYGGSTAMIANNARGNLSLIRFDLSSMQGQYDTITSVALFLRPAATPPTGITISAYSVLPANGDWVGGTSNGAIVTDGSSTWNSKESYGAGSSSNVAWEDSNGNDIAGLGLDKTKPTDSSTWGFGPTALDTTAAIPASGVTIRLNLPASLIQQWISGTNYGLVLTSTDGASGDVPQYYTGNKNNAAAPELVINYIVPEPMTGSLLLLSGGLLLLRRRKPSGSAV